MVGREQQQVLRLARTLRPRQRAQRLGSPGFLAGGLGEAGDHQFPFEESAGGLPAADVHDAGRRHRGGESVQRVAGTGASGIAEEMEREAIEERDRLRATTAAASALAYRRELHQHLAARSTTCAACWTATAASIVHWDLRESMTEADIEIILQGGQGEVPGGEAADHLRQRPAIHRAGFQGVHSHLGHDAREDVALLSAIERKDRALAQIAQSECIRPGTPLTPEDARRLIQQYVDHYNTVRLHSAIGFVTPADMLAGRQAEIHAARDRKLEEARQQRQQAPAAGGMSRRVTMTLPGETEAGSAGMQPCRGIAWWAHRDDVAERGSSPFALFPKTHRIGRPLCLENPRPEGAEYSLTENAPLSISR